MSFVHESDIKKLEYMRLGKQKNINKVLPHHMGAAYIYYHEHNHLLLNKGFFESHTSELIKLAYGDSMYDKSYVYLSRSEINEKGERFWNERFKSVKLSEIHNLSDITDFSKKGDEMAMVSTYITPVSYLSENKFNGSRSAKNIASFHNVVIDIDINMLHGKKKIKDIRATINNEYFKQLIGRANAQLLYELFSGYDSLLPEPNIIHFTGRGIQIWYCFNQLPANSAPIYKAIVDSLIKLLKKADEDVVSKIEDESNERVYTIDYGAMKSSGTGLYRMFNSYNHVTERRTYAIIMKNKKYDAEDLLKKIQLSYAADDNSITDRCPFCNSQLTLKIGNGRAFWACSSYHDTGCNYTRNDLGDQRPEYKMIHYTPQQKAQYRQRKIRSEMAAQAMPLPQISTGEGVAKKRIEFLIWLIDYRTENNMIVGSRNNIIFQLYNALVTVTPPLQSERDEQWETVKEINRRFACPLPDSQMRTIRKAVDCATTAQDSQSHEDDRCGHYSYKDETFIEFLCLTHEETKKYNSMRSSRAMLKEYKQREKKELNRQIIQRINNGESVADVAKAVGKSEKTVRRRICDIDTKKMRDDMIMILRRQGLSVSKIVEELNARGQKTSRSTVERVIRRRKQELPAPS